MSPIAIFLHGIHGPGHRERARAERPTENADSLDAVTIANCSWPVTDTIFRYLMEPGAFERPFVIWGPEASTTSWRMWGSSHPRARRDWRTPFISDHSVDADRIKVHGAKAYPSSEMLSIVKYQ